jgi:hypothetical protein
MIYIPKPVFYLVLVLIALLPLSKKAGLLLFGERTTGTAVDFGVIDSNKSYKYPGHYHVSMIRYIADGNEYMVSGPMNVIYEIGETVTVIYDKDDPSHHSLLTFTSLYSGYGMILAGFVLILWMAFYLTFAAKEPRKKKETLI